MLLGWHSGPSSVARADTGRVVAACRAVISFRRRRAASASSVLRLSTCERFAQPGPRIRLVVGSSGLPWGLRARSVLLEVAFQLSDRLDPSSGKARLLSLLRAALPTGIRACDGTQQ